MGLSFILSILLWRLVGGLFHVLMWCCIFSCSRMEQKVCQHTAVTIGHRTAYKLAGLCWYSRGPMCSFVACLRTFWDVDGCCPFRFSMCCLKLRDLCTQQRSLPELRAAQTASVRRAPHTSHLEKRPSFQTFIAQSRYVHTVVDKVWYDSQLQIEPSLQH